AAWELADEAFDSRHRAAHVIVEVKGGAMRQNPTLVAGVVEELGSRMPSFAEAAGQLGTWNKTEVEAGTLWARETPVVRENYSYRLVHEQLDSEGRLAEERVLLVPA